MSSRLADVWPQSRRDDMTRLASLAAVSLLLTQAPSPLHCDGKSWWAHVTVLAADDMEGRETGSEGLRKAEAYVVAQVSKAGLQPAGVDGFYQPVHFISRQIDEKASSAALVRDGNT